MTVLLDGQTVEILMCSLNEADYIRQSLESLLNQSLIADNPRNVWITLADSNSTDGTQDIARGLGVKVLDCPKGKLTARDFATRASNADIIIATDADTFYPEDFCENLVRPFSDTRVVAVGGGRRMDNPVGQFTEDAAFYGSLLGVVHRMCGGASAFRKQTYIDIGGFNLAIDQKNIATMILEEEILFGERLITRGKYVMEPKAIAHTSSRRVNLDRKFWQRIISGETF